MNYKWNYTYVGGVPRVKIATGDDIAHLGELDEKLWTVLSCPAKGLEIDEKSLAYIDTSGDSHVHVTEIVATSKWLCEVLRKTDSLLVSTDTVALEAINAETESGKEILAAAKHVLAAVGKANATEISLADSSSCLSAVIEKKIAELKAERAAQAEVVAPYGDQTAAVAEAYAALDAKVKDYFLRSRLAGFAAEGTAALDIQVEQIQAISLDNLTEKTADIAAYPIARITDGVPILPLDAAINPAWAAQWAVVKPLFTANISEADWAAVGEKLAAHDAYCKSLEVTEADIEVDEEMTNIQLVDKLLHLTRDFYTLLKNFVTFVDFYTPDGKGIFQAGRLYIDQRACDLCLKVTDMAAMTAQAPASGLFLVYCDCTSKVKNATMKIVAAITVGNTDNITVGKNAIFYDRDGHDWDAVVTAVADNPISIPQAAWSPYKKFMGFVEEKFRSMAQKREDAVIAKASATVEEKGNSAATALAATPGSAPAAPGTAPAAPGAPAAAPNAAAAGKSAASAFDIAKFAGIFAAIGMAVGFIGNFFVSLATGFLALKWWQQPLCILAIFLLISGPSMFLAWMKLRKRNLAPVLNANGWAVNAAAKISIRFGEALTSQAKFPLSAALRNQDPFADKEMPLWKKILGWVLVLAVILGVLWFFKAIHFSWLPQSPYSPEALTQAPAPAK